MRLRGLGQVQGRLKVHAQPPRLGKIGKGLEGRVVGFHAHARETALRRPGVRGEIDIATAHDRDQQAARVQHADRAPGDVTANGVEHHIDAVDVGGEVGGAVVDELIGAQARDEIMLGRARGADDVSAASLGDLNRQVPDAAATYSAYALAARGKNGMPYTSSPGWNRVTPGSTSSTTPLTSQPRMNGGWPSSGNCPDLITVSTGFTPTARTRTSISVGSGTGRATSVSSRTSGPPKAC